MGEQEKAVWGRPRMIVVVEYGDREFEVQDRGSEIRLGRIVGGRAHRTASIWRSGMEGREPDLGIAKKVVEDFLMGEGPSVEAVRRQAEAVR